MAHLIFRVVHQVIARVDDFKPVAKSQNYLRAEFTFSDDWGNDDKIAVFSAQGKNYEVILDEDNACFVPWEALTEAGQMYVSVYSGDRITASKARVDVYCTGFPDGDTSSTSEPSVDVYKVLTEKIVKIETYIDDLGLIVQDGILCAVYEDEEAGA